MDASGTEKSATAAETKTKAKSSAAETKTKGKSSAEKPADETKDADDDTKRSEDATPKEEERELPAGCDSSDLILRIVEQVQPNSKLKYVITLEYDSKCHKVSSMQSDCRDIGGVEVALSALKKASEVWDSD
jgi:hypothetical protein